MKSAMKTALVSAIIGVALTAASGTATASNAIIGHYPSHEACMQVGENLFGPWHGQYWCNPVEGTGQWQLRRGSGTP